MAYIKYNLFDPANLTIKAPEMKTTPTNENYFTLGVTYKFNRKGADLTAPFRYEAPLTDCPLGIVSKLDEKTQVTKHSILCTYDILNDEKVRDFISTTEDLVDSEGNQLEQREGFRQQLYAKCANAVYENRVPIKMKTAKSLDGVITLNQKYPGVAYKADKESMVRYPISSENKPCIWYNLKYFPQRTDSKDPNKVWAENSTKFIVGDRTFTLPQFMKKFPKQAFKGYPCIRVMHVYASAGNWSVIECVDSIVITDLYDRQEMVFQGDTIEEVYSDSKLRARLSQRIAQLEMGNTDEEESMVRKPPSAAQTAKDETAAAMQTGDDEEEEEQSLSGIMKGIPTSPKKTRPSQKLPSKVSGLTKTKAPPKEQPEDPEGDEDAW